MERVLLLVDDEPNVLEGMKRLLRKEGYRILTATSGQEGLELLEDNEVGVVISDQRMPGMTGDQFLSIVHARYPDTVRMVLSGYSDIDAVIAALNEGAIYKFLSKPWDDGLLRANIQEAFARWQQARDSAQFARVFENTGEGIIVSDASGYIQTVNPAFTRITGYSPEEVVGRTQQFLCADRQDGDSFQDIWTRVVTEGQWQGEIWNRRKDGTDYPQLTTIASVPDANGQHMQCVAMFSDISIRKEQERLLQKSKEAAESANETKSGFLANVSHELRTPMHAILSFSEIGEQKVGKAPDEKIRHYFTRVRQSGKRLLSLLNDLLDLSKLEAGRMDFDMQDRNIVDVISAALDELNTVARERGVTFSTQVLTEDPVLSCDSDRMLQVLRNLLFNAIKFSPQGGSVRVRLFDQLLPEGDGMAIAVEDQGRGIPEEELQDVFGKFVQSSRNTSGADGTGLGLAICHEIVKQHQGKIWAENIDTGGAVFTFVLPREADLCQAA